MYKKLACVLRLPSSHRSKTRKRKQAKTINQYANEMRESIRVRQLARFSVPFWLFHIFLYSFYTSYNRSIINKQGYGLDRKGTWKRGK